MVDVDVASLGVPMGGYGMGGCGMGGGFGAGMFGGVIGGLLFNGGLRGRHDGCCDDGVDTDLAYLLGRDSGLEAKTSDVVAATSNINETTRSTGAVVLNSINSLDGKLNATNIAMLQGFAGVDKGLCDNRHAADMQFAALSHRQAMDTCDIKLHTTCENEKTRAMLVQQNEHRLLDKLEAERAAHNETMRQRDLLATGNFPISQSAHVVKHCHDHDPRDSQVQIINQNVNAIGSTVAQLSNAVQALIAAKV